MSLDYSKYYAHYHPDDPGHRIGLGLLHKRMLAPLLPENLAAPILDIGCGRGYAIQDVQALGYTDLTGIELDAGQANYAREQGLDVTHVASTEDYLASRPGAYAAILLMDVLEHVPRERQPAFLQAVSRSLAPDGRLICTVPNAGSSIASYWLHNDYTHEMSFTTDSLMFLLNEGGFDHVACGGIEFALRPRFLFWLPTKRTIAWLLRCCFRLRRRMEYIGELGWERGRAVILTPNLLAIAEKKRA